MRNIFDFFREVIVYLTGRFSVFVNSAKSFLRNTYMQMGILSKKILFKLYTIKFRYIIVIYLINFFVGRLLALQSDFAGSLIQQIVLTVISIIGLYMLQYLHRVVNNMYDAMVNSNSEISICLDRFNKTRMSPLNILLPVFPMICVAKISIEMAYVPLSVIGYYEVFFYATAFYISLVCYLILILSTKMIYDLTKIEYTKLPFSYPNDLLEVPDWLKTLADIYRKGQFSFFTVGMLFTSEFITQTSHIKNGIRTLKNQYFSPKNTLMRLFLSVLMHPACILGDAEQSWL